MKYAFVFIFMILIQTSFVQAQTCEELFGANETMVNQKLDLLRELSTDVSDFLFRAEDIENNPKAFSDFINKLSDIDLGHLKARHIDTLVGSYIKANLQSYADGVSKLEQKRPESSEQALLILQDILSEQLKLQISNRPDIQLKASSLRITYQKNRNFFRATASAAAWVAVSLMSRSILPVPIYLPKFNRNLTAETKAELVKKLPKLSQAEAIVLINRLVPGSRGLQFYNGFQKIFWRLSLAAGLYIVAVSPAVMHLANDYTPFGQQIIEVKENVDNLWFKIFYSREHLQNLALEASVAFLNNPNDPKERAALEAQIKEMSFEQLRERIP